jgi:hypothetical protein
MCASGNQAYVMPRLSKDTTHNPANRASAKNTYFHFSSA